MLLNLSCYVTESFVAPGLTFWNVLVIYTLITLNGVIFIFYMTSFLVVTNPAMYGKKYCTP